MPTTSTLRRFTALVAILAMTTAACGDDDSPSSNGTAPGGETEGKAADSSLPPVKIGMVNINDGVPSFPGFRDGAQAAVKYINAELGGIGGHPVQLDSCDARMDAESTQACGQRFANDAEVKVVTTGIVLAGGGMYSVLNAAGKPIVGGAAATPADFSAKQTYFYFAGAAGVVPAISTFTIERFKPKSVAILAVSNPSARAAVPVVEGVLRNAGVQVKTVEVGEQEPDFVGPITAAGVKDADAFIAMTTSNGCIQVAKSLQQLGLRDVPVITGPVCSEKAVLEGAGHDAVDGWYFGDQAVPQGLPDGVDKDLDKYRALHKKYGTGDPTESGVALSFSNMVTLHRLLNEIGFDNITPQAVDAKLTAFKGPVFLGPPEVSCPGKSPSTAVCASKILMSQFKDGKWALVDDGQWLDVAS